MSRPVPGGAVALAKKRDSDVLDHPALLQYLEYVRAEHPEDAHLTDAQVKMRGMRLMARIYEDVIDTEREEQAREREAVERARVARARPLSPADA